MQYYKFSDERNKKYSIQTTIVEKNGNKFVEKTPIYPEGIEHIKNICTYQDMLEKAYPDIKICPVKFEKDKIVFDYIEGHLLLDEYERCMNLDDKEAFFELLEKHYQMICGAEDNKGIFEESEETKKWFGNMREFNGKPSLKIANFDATPSNIVVGDNISFIDYEWVFDCGIPTDLAVFHCIGDAYLHLENLEKFVPLQEAMHILRVFTPIEKMREFYQNFYKNVIEEKNDICFAEKKFECLQEIKKISDMRDEIQYVRSEWEKTAKNWQGSCEENDRLNKQIQALVSEKDNLNAIIDQKNKVQDRLELDNKNLNYKIDDLLHENAKLAQYWKDSCAKNREPVLLQKENERILQDKKTLEQRVVFLEQCVSDKDTHIKNIETMLMESREQYSAIVNSKRWRAIAKIARVFHR
ncbi:MAG: hypothetical protein MRZ75_13090 [Roseburia sp.]|uniref:hypothetical protein n=1 Tax=Roseburia sp. 831b TaxID=1261635 RepID=UPI0009522FC1|nr:hypothetical protein [Roseburia sp. 831b]MCI5920238.1 hypothetical protein [Roseburia sp.]WVK72004.1 hypothetical protein BIV16_09400 [Roseburia sp. 831b]